MDRHVYNFHGKILISANIRCFSDFFLVDATEREKVVEKVTNQLFVDVVDDVFFKEYNYLKQGSFGRTYHYNDHCIYYEKEFMGNTFKVLLENLETNQTRLVLSKNLLKRVKFSLPMTDLYSFSNYFNAVFVVKMLLQDMALVHSSAVRTENGNGLLFSAFPDTGKTTTAMHFLENPASKILSDDLNYVGYDNVAFLALPPYHISLHTVAETDLAKKFGMRSMGIRRPINTFMRRISFLPFVPATVGKIGMDVDIEDDVKEQVVKSTKINKIYILENAQKEEVVELKPEDAQRKLLSIAERELYFLNSNNVLLAYGYINEEVSIRNLKMRYYDLLYNFCKNADCYIVRANEPSKFAPLVTRTLKAMD